MNEREKKKKTVGLALGGGGAKGFAHIGIIQTLVSAGIEIDYIAGTSMGALVGGYYAATKNIPRLEAIANVFDSKTVFPSRAAIGDLKRAFFRDGLVEKLLEEEFHSKKIEDLEIPFRAIATDISNGDQVRIAKGRLVDALRASSALPIVFSPVEVGGRLLMDGGLSNPVPADVVREMGADIVIAVDVTSQWHFAPQELAEVNDVYTVLASALMVIEHQIARDVLKSADIVLRPAISRFHTFSYTQSREIIAAGREEAERALPDIRRMSGQGALSRTPIERVIDFLFFQK